MRDLQTRSKTTNQRSSIPTLRREVQDGLEGRGEYADDHIIRQASGYSIIEVERTSGSTRTTQLLLHNLEDLPLQRTTGGLKPNTESHDSGTDRPRFLLEMCTTHTNHRRNVRVVACMRDRTGEMSKSDVTGEAERSCDEMFVVMDCAAENETRGEMTKWFKAKNWGG